MLITGATSGIGLAAAIALARDGAQLVLVARSAQRARQAVTLIEQHTGPGAHVEVLFADLSLMSEVSRACDVFCSSHARLDVLINNAGAMFAKRIETSEGFEMAWALNHLAPFLLSAKLAPLLYKAAPGRIVTTSSGAHRRAGLDRGALDVTRSYRGFFRYGQTKLANVLFTAHLATRIPAALITATCFAPGLVATDFNLDNGRVRAGLTKSLRPFARSPQRGAETLLYLVREPSSQLLHGAYYARCRPRRPSVAGRDATLAAWLWAESERQLAPWLS